MFNVNVSRLALVFFLTLSVRAGTLDLSAVCGGLPGVPVGNSVSCTSSEGNSSASGTISTPWDAMVSASAGGGAGYDTGASVTYSTTHLIDVTGYSGSGFLVPCLSVGYDSPGSSGGDARLGTAEINTRTPVGGTCSDPRNSLYEIPLV